MEFYGIPLFDDDFYKMMFRFGINIAFLTIIIRCLYYRYARNKAFLFTYYMISVIVFFCAFALPLKNSNWIWEWPSVSLLFSASFATEQIQ